MSAPPPSHGSSDHALAHTLAAGLQLRDYRIKRVLGEGGFGIVYLADDLTLRRDVAIKEYLPSTIASRAADRLSVAVKSDDHTEAFAHGLKSFINEARLLGRFDHPALVKVHQFWEENGTAYMVMPYFEGPTLRRVLDGMDRLPTEDEIRAWLVPLLDALEIIHADNCFHRDIAPDNILITDKGPVLLDFGAARRVIGDLTHTITAVLKPGYAPIEQYGASEDMKQGPWTDLFALASVLYLAIAKAKPPASIDRIVVDRLKPLSTLAAGVYRPAFLAAIDRTLAVLPEYRPQSVAQFRSLLDSENVAPAGLPPTPSLLRPPSPPASGGAAPAPTPNNLPRQRTSFVGRETERAELKSLLGASALVTVLGMGGMGKTRLTIQVAGELLPRYPAGVWFIDLSAVGDPTLVVGALARALDVIEEPGRPLIDTVCAWLKARRVLLVVDNCEHVVEAAAEMVDAVLDRAPGVQVLASSREPLDVPGEQVYPIRPLPLPARDAGEATALQSAAARMFSDRARAHRPDFQAQLHEARLLADLLYRLEGIPLAIELAAARLRTMSLGEIVAGLDDRYQLLAGGSRLLQPRQQTLRALVDWSFDLLDSDEAKVFTRLAVFAGGFDEDAARSVCAEDEVTRERVPALVSSLAQKSLVTRDDDTAAVRYRLLDTLRDYARGKLGDSDSGAATSVRHCAHYFALAKEAGRGIQGSDQGLWVQRLDIELENLRAATACTLSGPADPLIAVKLAVALTGFWILRGHTSEGRRHVDAALALPAVRESPLAQAWALYTAAALAENQGDHEAASTMLERCLALRRALGNPVEIAATLSTLALARLQAGDTERAAVCEAEALKLFASVDDPRGQAIGWLHLGQIHLWAGDAEGALDDLQRGRAFAREIANREIEAECELTVAEVRLHEGRPELAEDAARRSMDICREAGDKRGEGCATWWLGRIGVQRGQAVTARLLLQQALAEFRAHDMRAQMLGCLDDLGQVMLEAGEPRSACTLATAIDQSRRRWKLNRSPWDETRWQALLKRIRSLLSAADAESAARVGREWETDDAMKAALADAAMPTMIVGSA